MTFGDVIRQYREDHGMTMASFAEKCGITKGYVSQLESNSHPKTGKPITPSPFVLRKIATVMNTDIDGLLSMVDGDMVISFIPDPSEFNSTDIAMIEKYHLLDESGKQTVDSVLDLQYKRVMGSKIVPLPGIKTLAAHEKEDASIEEKQSDITNMKKRIEEHNEQLRSTQSDL